MLKSSYLVLKATYWILWIQMSVYFFKGSVSDLSVEKPKIPHLVPFCIKEFEVFIFSTIFFIFLV